MQRPSLAAHYLIIFSTLHMFSIFLFRCFRSITACISACMIWHRNENSSQLNEFCRILLHMCLHRTICISFDFAAHDNITSRQIAFSSLPNNIDIVFPSLYSRSTLLYFVLYPNEFLCWMTLPRCDWYTNIHYQDIVTICIRAL